jgi:hypothetical protein
LFAEETTHNVWIIFPRRSKKLGKNIKARRNNRKDILSHFKLLLHLLLLSRDLDHICGLCEILAQVLGKNGSVIGSRSSRAGGAPSGRLP